MTDGHQDEQNWDPGITGDVINSDEAGLIDDPRIARIAGYNNKPVGICIFLTVADLDKLGVNVDQIDTDLIEYTIDQNSSQLKIGHSIGD